MNLNESALFKMMEKMDITLGDIESMPHNIIGDHLLKLRRKKRSRKRTAE